jgi:hypothetical protein
MTLRKTLLTISAMVAGVGSAGCATQAGSSSAEARAAEADAILAEYTVTGETRNCLRLHSVDSIDPLDDTRWLITMRNGDTYLNEVSGACSQASSGFTYLHYATSGGSLCSNEIVRVLDRGTNTQVGSCGLNQYQQLVPASDDA